MSETIIAPASRKVFLQGLGLASLAGCSGVGGASLLTPVSESPSSLLTIPKRRLTTTTASYPQSFSYGSGTVTVNCSGNTVSMTVTNSSGSTTQVLSVTGDSSAQTLTYAPVNQNPYILNYAAAQQPSSMSLYGSQITMSSATNSSFTSPSYTGSLAATNDVSGTASHTLNQSTASGSFSYAAGGGGGGGGGCRVRCVQGMNQAQATNTGVGMVGIVAGIIAIVATAPAAALAAGFLALAIAIILLFRALQ